MCTCMLLNVGAVRSISNAHDGELVLKETTLVVDGKACTFDLPVSNGAAESAGFKRKLMPQVWQWIADGQGLEFEIVDDQLVNDLSFRLFAETREAIDALLGSR